MISELFEQISARSPRLKRWMWRVWYDLLAYTCRDPTWTFMNFGYRHSDPAIEVLPLLPEDEPDRSAIQLYITFLAGWISMVAMFSKWAAGAAAVAGISAAIARRAR